MRKFLLFVVIALELLVLVCCHGPGEEPIRPKPKRHGGVGHGGSHGGGHGGSHGGGHGGVHSGGGFGTGGAGSGGANIESCPRPSPESIKCLQQWACQQVIRLDLRCLLNLNGNNLLGNLVSIPGIAGGGNAAGGGAGGGGGGILGGLLGR
ncbi:cold shock protein 2 [Drosophila innubila]|uniref:cold shock protein 2 n=1 Tax=Drosophila innubila TaxID=198719 RepID=UPI00148E6777|nr:cold shock protein 2 [Drosophila innubila]